MLSMIFKVWKSDNHLFLRQAEDFTWSFPERYMHGWRLRKKTLNPGTVEYCQLWWVYDKLKNIHKHSTSKAGKEGGELRRVKCLGHPIFSQHKEAIFRKPTYTSRNTKVGKEFFLMVPFFTPPYKWHCYKRHSTLCPQGKLSATHSPHMKKNINTKDIIAKNVDTLFQM